MNCLLGVGLFFSPWLFGFEAEQTAAWNAHVIGAIIAVMALAAIFAFQDLGGVGQRRIGRLACHLTVGTRIQRRSAPAMLTHVLIGIAALILAIWSSAEHGSHLPAGR